MTDRIKIKYWWSEDKKWFCILSDDGNHQATISLTVEEASLLSMNAAPPEHTATSDPDVPVCDRCERPVDPVKNRDDFGGLCCENCMEAAYDREQERLMECGPGPSLLEQAQQGYKDKHGLR